MSESETPEAQKAVAIVKAWMNKRGYSTGAGDNIGYLLANLESQMWDRVRSEAGMAEKNGRLRAGGGCAMKHDQTAAETTRWPRVLWCGGFEREANDGR